MLFSLLDNFLMCDSVRLDVDDKFFLTNLQIQCFKTFLLLFTIFLMLLGYDST